MPTVLALNMMDEVNANGGSIDVALMSKLLGVPVVPISAVKGEGISELVDKAVQTARDRALPKVYDFCGKRLRRAPVHPRRGASHTGPCG